MTNTTKQDVNYFVQTNILPELQKRYDNVQALIEVENLSVAEMKQAGEMKVSFFAVGCIEVCVFSSDKFRFILFSISGFVFSYIF